MTVSSSVRFLGFQVGSSHEIDALWGKVIDMNSFDGPTRPVGVPHDETEGLFSDMWLNYCLLSFPQHVLEDLDCVSTVDGITERWEQEAFDSSSSELSDDDSDSELLDNDSDSDLFDDDPYPDYADDDSDGEVSA